MISWKIRDFAIKTWKNWKIIWGTCDDDSCVRKIYDDSYVRNHMGIEKIRKNQEAHDDDSSSNSG